MCTVNVGTVVGRGGELVEMMARRRVDICCLQEVRYRGKGCRVFKHGEDHFKFWWSGNPNGVGGVGIMLRRDLEEEVVEVERINPRIMKVKIVMGGRVVQVISAYAPQAGRPDEEKEEFWGLLDDTVSAIPASEGLIIGGDLNGHVGTERGGYEEVMGVYGV